MPGLPEVESARAVIGRNGLGRRITDVDDSDAFVCRPHVPGEIRHALLGSELTTAMRRGKSMSCQVGPSPGPVTLGIHLGMSGKIVIAEADGSEIDGGDYWEGRREPGDYRWARFTVAAWPAVALVGSYELLMVIIRRAQAPAAAPRQHDDAPVADPPVREARRESVARGNA